MANAVKIVFLFTFIFSATFAYWSEKIDVQVIDIAGRPISNADVTIVYQSVACSTHSSIVKATGADGKAHFEFINTIEETAVTTNCVERLYPITVNYAGTSRSIIGDVNRTDKLYVVTFPVVYYMLRVTDANDNPLSDSIAQYDGATYRADIRGIITLPTPIGIEQNVKVIFGNAIKNVKIVATADSSETVKLPVYDLRVRVFNEFGLRIAAVVNTDNLTLQATELSDAIFEKFSSDIARITISVDDKIKKFDLKVTEQILDVYFDLSPPSIRDFRVEVVERGNLKMSVAVVDEGTYAAGISVNPQLLYAFDNENFTQVQMFPVGDNRFSTVVPSHGANTDFKIIATDSQNNSATYNSSYLFVEEKKKEEAPVVPVSPIHIVGLIIFVIVVIFVYQKLREQF